MEKDSDKLKLVMAQKEVTNLSKSSFEKFLWFLENHFYLQFERFGEGWKWNASIRFGENEEKIFRIEKSCRKNVFGYENGTRSIHWFYIKSVL